MHGKDTGQSSKPTPRARLVPGRISRNPSNVNWLRLLLFILPTVALLAGGSAANTGDSAVALDRSATCGAISPVADWIEDLGDDLDDAGDEIDEASITIGMKQGPLPEPDLSLVAGRLDRTLAIVDRILDPNRYPSLDPPDAGSVDTAANPTTLPGYARECLDRIRAAGENLDSGVVDANAIGTHLRTIRHLITRSSPHNYRSKAGITLGDG